MKKFEFYSVWSFIFQDLNFNVVFGLHHIPSPRGSISNASCTFLDMQSDYFFPLPASHSLCVVIRY